MTTLVPIGEFSRLSHLTVKTLRHYHDIGLLEPHQIDDQTGYRRCTTDQVPDALLIGRLRALAMPLPQVQRVLTAGDPSSRETAIADHLARMEHELDLTRQIVGSLRELLRPDPGALAVTYCSVADQPAVGITAAVDHPDVESHCEQAYARLSAELAEHGVDPTGPAAATYDDDFFTRGRGRVTTYLPVHEGAAARALDLMIIPGGRYAVAEHTGSFAELDRTYGALGSHVARADVVVPGPIREVYRVGPPEAQRPDDYRCDVYWPVADL